MYRRLICLSALVCVLGCIQANTLWSSAARAEANLAGWWKLDEGTGTTVNDSSGNENTGSIKGNPQWVEGKFGGALSLDGTGDYVNCGNGPSLQIQEQITMSLWIKSPGLGGTNWRCFVSKGDGAYRLSGSSITANAAHMGFNGTTSSPNPWMDGTIIVADDEWHHVAGVYDGTEARLYVDLVLDIAQNATGLIAAGSSNLLIGENEQQTGRTVIGTLDEVRIYNRALTLQELTTISNGGSLSIAGNPNPVDEATDVPRDIVLTWVPGPYSTGADVYFGTKFEDVNTASRANPLSVLVEQDQDANSYDPDGLLELGQTYYWRIDDINTPNSETFRGDVWSFTVEPYSFAIPGSRITASASSVGKPDWGPEKTIDGSGLNASDQHSTAAVDMWVTATGPAPVWIQYAFDQPYLLDKMMVWNSNQTTETALGVGAKDVTVEYSMDGDAWTPLGDFVFNKATAKATYTANTEVSFGGITARYIKITINSNWGNKLKTYSLSEVRFFSIPVAARLPYPTSGATDVDPQVTLSWRAGRQAASHQVYLSTDQQAVTDATAAPITTSQSSYDATVDLVETYYWKVVEVNEIESTPAWTSDVWSFSTATYVVVEDFEQYTNISPDRVFQTWRDGTGFSADEFFPNGYAGNDTGSIVGYDPQGGDIMDTDTFHGGRNSMPVEYHNTTGVTTSETTRTFDEAQDWTKSAIKTLVLYFYGDPTNAGAQLYVKVNSTKIAYNGEAANLQRRRWNQCSIDLAAVPASSLQSVKTLTIGVENAGEGKLLFDDLRLYRTAPEVPVAVTPSTADLVAYYAMENNVQDSSGSGNHGTIVGAPTYVPGLAGYGTALQFNGIDDYVDLGNKAIFNPPGSFSVSLWANITDWSTAEWGHVMIGNRGEGGVGWQIRRYSSSATLCFTTRGTGSEDIPSRSAMPLNEWVHIACVYDNAGNTKRIYVNGTQDVVAATTAGTTILATTMNTYIGARANSGNTGPEYLFTGALDEIRVYNRALSAGEVEYLSDPTP